MLDCPIVGVAIDDWDDEQLREHAARRSTTTVDRARRGRPPPARRPAVLRPGRLRRGGDLREGGKAIEGGAAPVFYLEVPPSLFATVVHGLAGRA